MPFVSVWHSAPYGLFIKGNSIKDSFFSRIINRAVLMIIGSSFFMIGFSYDYNAYIPGEISVFVELGVNKSKSKEEIKDFAKKYQEFVVTYEVGVPS